MALTAALMPFGKQYRLDYSSGGVTTVDTDASDNRQGQQYIFSNDGTVTCFVTFTPPAIYGGAVPVAAAPAVGTPALGIPLLAGTVQTFNLCAGARIAALSSSGSGTLWIVVGEGG